MLTTLLPPTEGIARVAGFDIVHEAREVRRHVGYVPQLLSADGSLTGRENLSLSAKLYGIPARERRARIDEALAFMDLAGAADALARRYSGGMIRRLEIAQALLHRPPVVFLDEPTSTSSHRECSRRAPSSRRSSSSRATPSRRSIRGMEHASRAR